MPVAELQVHMELRSPEHKGAIVSLRWRCRRGRGEPASLESIIASLPGWFYRMCLSLLVTSLLGCVATPTSLPAITPKRFYSI